MFNDTVTVYNKYVENGAEKWQRVVLKGVYWNAVRGALMRKTGASSTDSVVVIIPKSIDSAKSYAPQKEFAALTDKSGRWTLSPGDTVVKGNQLHEIERSTSELSALDDVMIVTSADYKDFGGNMAHWEVSGK